MRQLISDIDWENDLNPLHLQDAWHYFSTVFDDIVAKCIPLDLPRPKKNIYMTNKALRLKNKKCKLWNRYIATRSPSIFNAYRKTRNELRNLTRNLRYMHEKKLVSNCNNNSKHFWKYVNSRLRSRPAVDILKKSDGSIVSSDKDKSILFNDFFTSVFTREDTSSMPSFSLNRETPTLNSITVTPSIVYDKLKNSKSDKAPGPEGWPVLALKETAKELCIPLCVLFTKSLQSASVPEVWKQAFVTPIHKKGERCMAENYRPISLTSTIGKILESIIRDQIYQHLTANDLLAHNQHGFTSGRSCTTQLLHAMDYWTSSLDNNIPVDILYLDFRKAFDTVPHCRLFTKLEAYGICGKLLDWIKTYLTNRHQKVVLNGASSEWSRVYSGVPQGSVLGPLLFNIYVNDIPSIVDSQTLMFADDTKIFRKIQSKSDFLQFQQDINNLFSWSAKWQLKFNVSKCFIFHLGPNHSYGNYFLDGDQILPNNIVRDLGVTMDCLLKFHEHTNLTVAKANRVLGLIRKTFNCKEPDIITKLFKSLVRPILEYGNLIWGPHYVVDQQAIEGVQRRATKLISSICHYPYSERLQILNLPSLCYRRLRGDMIFLYRITHNFTDSSLLDLFQSARATGTRGHNFKFFKPRCNSRFRHNFFSYRTIDSWNNLPLYIVNANSINLFKNLLDNHHIDILFIAQ